MHNIRVKISKINQGEESHSNQGDPHGEFIGTLLWGIRESTVSRYDCELRLFTEFLISYSYGFHSFRKIDLS